MRTLIFLSVFVTVVAQQPKAITKNWVFVIDTSDSMKGVFDMSMDGVEQTLKAPVDEHKFSAVVFNDLHHFKKRKVKKKWTIWHEGCKDEFDALRKWVRDKDQHGTSSHGMPALLKALKRPVKQLTVLVISDGGFTSSSSGKGFDKLKKQIREVQAWRVTAGHGEATICSIGISNPHYSNLCKCWKTGKCINPTAPDVWMWNRGQKMPDAECQAFMKWMGKTYKGGYFLVRRK